MSKKQFKAESKRLLDLMINSIYTHREIFLRELISNASDASDKRYFNALSKGESGVTRDDLFIGLTTDREARALTISDRGCGMTKEALESDLGIIAHSGSLQFKRDNQDAKDVDIIGQFGVGFYSAFMVSSRIAVVTKSQETGECWRWESAGADGYTISPAEKEEVGTDIILTLKEDSEEENYSQFLEQHRLRELIKKYSDYVRYPIRMEVTRSRRKEDSPDDKPEYEEITETETLNSMIPIWKRGKSEVSDEDYAQFYKEKFFDYEDPLRIVHSSTEGAATYDALLFLPARAPYNYYSKDFEKGLQLYASGVLIMERCADLLPDHFSFVKGLVDSQDLSLNISREMLQHDRQLKVIANRLEKKIKSELFSMQKDDRDKYVRFFESFGLQLKWGIYNGYGQNKELLADLLLYRTSALDGMTTLDEYVGRMKEEQKHIYYACGESASQLSRLPQAERLIDKGYEILYMTDDVDEFAVKMMRDYKEKEFRSVSDGDLGLETEEEREEVKQLSEENKPLFDSMKEALGERVHAVRPTGRLKSFPVCLTTEGGVSLEMEKVLGAMPNGQRIKAERILEINAQHPVFEVLKGLLESDRARLSAYTDILYQQALLIEGLSIDDPVGYANAVCDLMTQK